MDTTVIDPTADNWSAKALQGPGNELEEVSKRKQAKYARHVREFGPNAVFVAAACSIYGGVSKEFDDLIKTIAEQGSLHTNGLYTKAELQDEFWTTVAGHIHRGNEAMIRQGTAQSNIEQAIRRRDYLLTPLSPEDED